MKNKKMLFISSFNPEIVQTNGVAKKLRLEIETFKKFGYIVDYSVINTEGVYLVENDEFNKLDEWKGTYHKTFIALYNKLRVMTFKWDILYVRYEHISLPMLIFFSTFKQQTKGIIIGELPTYIKKPYSSDSLKTKIFFYGKFFLNLVVPKKIDYMVTFSDDKKIFGIPTIPIENFADVVNLTIKSGNFLDRKRVNLLVLAQLSIAHGVDLVIKGLYNYLSQDETEFDVRLNIVGDGPILEELKILSKNLKLDNFIKFYGTLGGDKLDEIFDQSDIGIGAIAIFRKNSIKLSELKIREFAARGLPFIYNALEPQIEGAFFAHKIDFKDQPLNINEVLEFYKRLLKEENFKEKIREFAMKEFTADKQLLSVDEKITSYFKG
ncbi:MAG: glycosyltransferase [Myroides sp.]